MFAIRTRPDDRLVGITQLKNIHAVHRSAELTIQIGEEADRGRGYGTEAVTALISYGWRELNLHRISLRVLAGNVAATKAYESAGLTVEGRLRSCVFIDNRWNDMLVMAIVRNDESGKP